MRNTPLTRDKLCEAIMNEDGFQIHKCFWERTVVKEAVLMFEEGIETEIDNLFSKHNDYTEKDFRRKVKALFTEVFPDIR